MSILRILSSSEQVAEYLRDELKNQVWTGLMPGGDKLARELGVGANTMEAALKMLESEGWLVNQGRRRGRLIQQIETSPTKKRLRVCILLGESSDRFEYYINELFHTLEEEGFLTEFAAKSQEELGDNPKRVAQLVGNTTADAWIVCSATADVLKWFVDSEKTAFALAGRNQSIKISSITPDRVTPLRKVLKKMVGLGHRRICLMCRPMRRIPEPGLFEREFLRELERLGIPTGPYNLPNWDENPDSFHRSLDSLFSITPPTVLIVDESLFIPPTLQFCIRAGLSIPDDFSLICTDPDPSFAWCDPSIAHIKWESRPITKRIVRWLTDATHGKQKLIKERPKAKFIEGGSIGTALKGTSPKKK